jgi:predicted nucleotide-binding protein (sugar kinase/HSP70/actin superfamily)
MRSMARADSGAALPRVLVTGEVYVRLEPFANGFLVKQLNDRSIRVTVESTSDLLRYSDHTAWANGEKQGLAAHLESWVQRRLAELCHREATRHFGLPPKVPVKTTLRAAGGYLRDDLEGEAVLSLGGPLHAWRHGEIDAAVLAGPLECMPNKLAEAQFTHAAEREGLVTLTLAMSGEPIDPELLDNFAFDVHRRSRREARHPTGRPDPPAA